MFLSIECSDTEAYLNYTIVKVFRRGDLTEASQSNKGLIASRMSRWKPPSPQSTAKRAPIVTHNDQMRTAMVLFQRNGSRLDER